MLPFRYILSLAFLILFYEVTGQNENYSNPQLSTSKSKKYKKREVDLMDKVIAKKNVNNTRQIQAISNQKNEVYFSEGEYSLDSLVLKSNTSYFGIPGKTILHQNNSGYGLLTYVAPNNLDSTRLHDVLLYGITFQGDVQTLGFFEHKHLLNLNGTKNLRIENCKFLGFQGDGILLGSSNTWGDERHNENITISNCFFDGINNDNRQGVSIIDGMNIVIEKCTFQNITRLNMPGAIDIEPDAINVFARISNIIIRKNKFINIGGSVGIISVAPPPIEYKNKIGDILIIDNSFENNSNQSPYAFAVYNANTGKTELNITVKRNIFKGGRGFFVSGAANINIIENSFIGAGNNGIGYLDVKSTARNIMLSNNIFKSCNFLLRPTISIGFAKNITIVANKILDNVTNTIHFIAETTSDSVTIQKNEITVRRGIPVLSLGKNHRTTANKNSFYENKANSEFIDKSFSTKN